MEEKLKDNGRNLRAWLFNPFQYVAGLNALLFGVAILVLTSLLASLSHTHFDGAIDVHKGGDAPVYLYIIESFQNWLILSIVFYVTSLIVSKSRVRGIDIFGTQALARWPMLLPALSGFVFDSEKVAAYFQWALLDKGEEVILTTGDWVLFIISALMDLLAIIWMVALMYNAWRISANLRGAKAVWSFIIGLIMAIILTELSMYLITNNLITQ